MNVAEPGAATLPAAAEAALEDGARSVPRGKAGFRRTSVAVFAAGLLRPSR